MGVSFKVPALEIKLCRECTSRRRSTGGFGYRVYSKYEARGDILNSNETMVAFDERLSEGAGKVLKTWTTKLVLIRELKEKTFCLLSWGCSSKLAH